MLKHHQEDVRKKIQVSAIFTRLTKHLNGEVELTPTQVQAARILLDKAVSNAPTDINSNMSGDLTLEIVRYSDTPAK